MRTRVKNGGAFVRTVNGVKVKRCAGCKVDHPLDAFTKGTGPGGLNRHCRAYHAAWRARRKQQRAA